MGGLDRSTLSRQLPGAIAQSMMNERTHDLWPSRFYHLTTSEKARIGKRSQDGAAPPELRVHRLCSGWIATGVLASLVFLGSRNKELLNGPEDPFIVEMRLCQTLVLRWKSVSGSQITFDACGSRLSIKLVWREKEERRFQSGPELRGQPFRYHK